MRAYPSNAEARGVSGVANLSCLVRVDGSLTGCSVTSETPGNQGFGRAAMGLTPRPAGPRDLDAVTRLVERLDAAGEPDTSGLMERVLDHALDNGFQAKRVDTGRRFARLFDEEAVVFEEAQDDQIGRDAEADQILQRVQEGVEKPKPKVLFEPGQMVRVTDGPFNDFNGVVEEVNYEKSRLRVAVLIFGRSTPVELEFGQVEKS